jgi:hypothetical protein
LFDKIDFRLTYENILTSGFFERAKLPLIAETDEQAVEYALRGAGAADARIVRIRSTLHLEEMLVSSPVRRELEGRAEIEVLGESPLLT